MPCPVICRDEIKEGMVHASGTGPAAGDDLNQPTLRVFFEALRLMVMAEVTVVAEANFQDRVWRSGLEPLADLARLRIVQCHVDPAIARDRREAAAEAGSGRFHARIIGDTVEDWEVPRSNAFPSPRRQPMSRRATGLHRRSQRFCGSSTPASEAYAR
jgi:hypothetical protein